MRRLLTLGPRLAVRLTLDLLFGPAEPTPQGIGIHALANMPTLPPPEPPQGELPKAA